MFRNESFFVKCLWRTVTAAVLATGLAGCEPAPQSQKTPAAGKSTSRPTSKAHLPPLTARSLQTLDQLQPPVSRPTNKPYTRKLPASAKRTLAQARELLKKEDYPGAIDKLERALGFDPKNPHVRRLLGLTYMQLPNYGKAAANLREAEKYLGDDVVLQLLLGRLAMQQNQIDTALLHCRKALKCSNANPADSKTAGALLLTAQLLDRQGHWTAALEAYEKLEKQIGRQGLPWYITLPTFEESDWYPTPEQMEAGLNFLREELGERLVGVDFWRLEWLMTTPEGQEMLEMLMSYDWGGDDTQDEEPGTVEDPPEDQDGPIGIQLTVTNTDRPVSLTLLAPDGGSAHIVEG